MNCIVFEIDSEEITYFVKDCLKQDNDFKGSNVKLYGIKPEVWEWKWITAELTPNPDDSFNEKPS